MVVVSAAFLTGGATFAEEDKTPENASEPPVKTVYLTFDDGPSKITLTILDILKKHDVPATFFVCGNVTEFGRTVYNRILDEGHALGNHTFSHRYDNIYASVDAFDRDVARLDDLIFKFTDTRPRLLRFPGGSNNTVAKNARHDNIAQELVNRMAQKGYRHFDWNVDSHDYGAEAKNAEAIAKTVVENAAKLDQAIVLMHDSYLRAATAEALPRIIKELRAKNYSFEALSSESFAVQFLKPVAETDDATPKSSSRRLTPSLAQ